MERSDTNAVSNSPKSPLARRVLAAPNDGATVDSKLLAPPEVGDKGEYRRLQNDMQIMTFKVRALEEKVEKIVKDAGVNVGNGPAGKGVAFTARLRNNVTARSLQNLIFDDVLTNIGNAYNPDTGIFKVPYSGRYLSVPTVIGQLTAGDSEIDRASASVTVVVILEAGNEVYVRETKTWTGHFYGEGYTVFTGILLQ